MDEIEIVDLADRARRRGSDRPYVREALSGVDGVGGV